MTCMHGMPPQRYVRRGKTRGISYTMIIRSNPPSSTVFGGLICVKPEVLIVRKANECKTKEEEHHLHIGRASAKESSMKEQATQLNALLLSTDRERAPPQIDQAALISSVIQGIFSQRFMVALSTYLHLQHRVPRQHFPR